MDIKVFRLGFLSTNSYVVYDDSVGYIIDLGGDNLKQITDFIEEKGIEIKGVLFTHGHFDHIQGLDTIMAKYPEADIFIGERDLQCLTDPYENLSIDFSLTGLSYEVGKSKMKTLKEGDKIWKFEVYETPGHTAGSLSFFCREEQIIFSGDLIFYESYGRTDFNGGDFITLTESIKKVVALGDDVKIYPGHYRETTTKEFREWFENAFQGDF